MTTQAIHPEQLQEFIDYCLDFYAPESEIMPEVAMTKTEAYAGLLLRLTRRPDLPFDGDTVDRELVLEAVFQIRETTEAA